MRNLYSQTDDNFDRLDTRALQTPNLTRTGGRAGPKHQTPWEGENKTRKQEHENPKMLNNPPCITHFRIRHSRQELEFELKSIVSGSHILRQLLRHGLDDIALDILHRALNVDRHSIPLALGLFQRSQLRLDHAALHVVGLALGDALQEDILVELEVDEVDADGGRAVGSDAHDVPVLPLEGRAGDDDAGRWVEFVAFRGGEGVDGGLSEGDQPVPAVCVCEGGSFAHFLLIGGWVVLGVLLDGDLGGLERGRGGGLTSSPSKKGTPSSLRRTLPTVLLPQPAGPVTTQMCCTWAGLVGFSCSTEVAVPLERSGMMRALSTWGG